MIFILQSRERLTLEVPWWVPCQALAGIAPVLLMAEHPASHPASDVTRRTNRNINNNNIPSVTLRVSYQAFTRRMASDQVDHPRSYFMGPVMAITDGWVVSIRQMLLIAEALTAGKSVISKECKDHSKITNDPTLSQWNVDEFGTSLQRKERTSPLHYFKEKETTQQQNVTAYLLVFMYRPD